MRIRSLLGVILLACCAARPTTMQVTSKPSNGGYDSESPIVHPLRPARPIDQLKADHLYNFNECDVDAYLKYLAKSEPDPIARLVHLARKNIGQPYQLYLLGEAPYELYDPDPMYCLGKSDCVTFVEHMYAMALSHDWPSFFKTLQRIRYKDGKVGMLTRNHETVADWNKNNAWLFDDITAKLGDGNQTVPLHMTWQPSKFFKKFGIGQDIPDVKVIDAYIPRNNVQNILADLHTGDVMQIVRGDPEKEQWVGHVGLVVMGDDKVPHFLNSTEPRVREEPVLQCVQKNSRTIGIKILRPRESLQQLVDAQVK